MTKTTPSRTADVSTSRTTPSSLSGFQYSSERLSLLPSLWLSSGVFLGEGRKQRQPELPHPRTMAFHMLSRLLPLVLLPTKYPGKTLTTETLIALEAMETGSIHQWDLLLPKIPAVSASFQAPDSTRSVAIPSMLPALSSGAVETQFVPTAGPSYHQATIG